MTMHPEELLSRFPHLAPDDPRRREVEDHLRTCEACRRERERYRRVEAALTPEPTPAGGFEAIRDKLIREERRKTNAMRFFAGLAVVQTVLGILVLVLFHRTAPLVAVLVGGTLLIDSGFALGIHLVARAARERLRDATAAWSNLRAAWREQLTQRMRAARSGGWSALGLVVVGTLQLGLGLARGDGFYLAIGLPLLSIGVIGLVTSRIHGERARSEQAALAALFPNETG